VDDVSQTPLLTAKEVSDRLNISLASAYRLLESGAISVVVVFAGKRKKTLRVRQEVLERWIRQREKGGFRGVQTEGPVARNQAVHGLFTRIRPD